MCPDVTTLNVYSSKQMTQPIKKRTSFNPSKILEKIPPSLRELLLEELDNKRVVYNNVLLCRVKESAYFFFNLCKQHLP